MALQDVDSIYMRRAAELARLGLCNTSPNPHVGAVIVCDGRIIGEGFHRRIGEGHAEVNAITSVKTADIPLLSRSTIYVTLEPCSHYGKTPPCAKLIVDKGLRRVVIGSTDPSPKVNGKGIAMLRAAGIEVDVLSGKVADECRELNPQFNARYVKHRPFITLKWAQTADGFMADPCGRPLAISTPLTSTLVHRLRSEHDVILTTSSTVMCDNPRLDTRFWEAGQAPLRAVVDRYNRVSADANVFRDDCRPTLYYTLHMRQDLTNAEQVLLPSAENVIEAIVGDLYGRNVNSVLVEAGPRFLSAMMEKDLFDCIRVECSNQVVGSSPVVAPHIPMSLMQESSRCVDGNIITTYKK